MEPEPATTEPAGNAPATPTSAGKKRLPTTAWMVYLGEHRDALMKEHPGMPFTEVTKLLGERYRQLDAEAKRQLAEIADANKAAVREEKAQQEPVKAKAPAVAAEKYSSMDLVTGRALSLLCMNASFLTRAVCCALCVLQNHLARRCQSRASSAPYS